MNKTLFLIWLFTLAILIWQGVSAYPELPERMVSSFDAAGSPKGETAKNGFFLLWYSSIAIINVIVPLMSWLARAHPALISVPNREFWLSTPERHAQFADRMGNFSLILTILLNLLFFLILKGTIDVNFTGRATLPVALIWGTIGVLLIIPLVMIFQMFRVPKEGNE